MNPQHFLDQTRLNLDIGPPRRRFGDDRPVAEFGFEAKRIKDAPRAILRNVEPSQGQDPLWSKSYLPRYVGHLTSDRQRARFATEQFGNQPGGNLGAP